MPLHPSLELVKAQPADGKAVNEYLRSLYASEKHLITRIEEVTFGPTAQRKWIRDKMDHPLTTVLLVKDLSKGDKLVGMLDSWVDARARVCHVASFGMSVHAEYRRKGIGRALLEAFAQWVADHRVLEKIELHVHSDNLGAHKLYEDMGFVKEGLRKEAVRYEDGRVVDDILMAYWPGRPHTYSSDGTLG